MLLNIKLVLTVLPIFQSLSNSFKYEQILEKTHDANNLTMQRKTVLSFKGQFKRYNLGFLINIQEVVSMQAIAVFQQEQM